MHTKYIRDNRWP